VTKQQEDLPLHIEENFDDDVLDPSYVASDGEEEEDAEDVAEGDDFEVIQEELPRRSSRKRSTGEDN
jgi:hypothetical protein